jgi:A/G-specific adenine glycosylase
MLIALPGVGDYSARAVLSFAFGEDVPIVDTNVARFLYRLCGLPGPMPANPARKRSLIELAGELVPAGRAKEFNLAILDLCAQICRPKNPLCTDCPVNLYCICNVNGEPLCQ